MPRLVPALALLLLLLNPGPAAAAESSADAEFTPPSPTELPEPADEIASADEVKRNTAKGLNPTAKIVSLVAVIPLSAAGLAVTGTTPIPWGIGDQGVWQSMRSSGISLMSAGTGVGIWMNIFARTSRTFVGGKWEDGIGLFIAGTALSVGGIALGAVGTTATLLVVPPAAVPVLSTGLVAYAVGTLLLVVDTVRIADSNQPMLSWSPRNAPQFAGIWAAPSLEGGASVGFALRF